MIIRNRPKIVLAIAAVAMVVVGLTTGEVKAGLITPTGASASSFLGGGSNYEPDNARDGSGLNAPFDETATHNAGSGTNTMWLSSTSESGIGANLIFKPTNATINGAKLYNFVDEFNVVVASNWTISSAIGEIDFGDLDGKIS